MKMGEREEWVCMCVRERERVPSDVVEEERGKAWLVRADNRARVSKRGRNRKRISLVLNPFTFTFHSSRGSEGERMYLEKVPVQLPLQLPRLRYMRFFLFFFSATRSQRRSIHVPRSPLYVRDICPSLLLFDISRSLLDVYRIDNSPLFPRVYIPIS